MNKSQLAARLAARTGEPVEIAPATVPAFKPGKSLKDAVNVGGGS